MTELITENEQDKVEIKKEIQEAIETVCKKTLEYEGFEYDAEISITITDNERIRQINREFRGIDKATDVLSFPMTDDGADSSFDFDGDALMLGDIVISAERAKEQAVLYGHSFLREMAFLTVHSMLHLLGYDHVGSKEEEKLMFSKQEEILKSCGIKRE